MRNSNRLSRRDFLATAATATAGALLPAAASARADAVNIGPSAELKVGVIGCGGRGTGAAIDCANADPGVVVVALADVFPERVEGCANTLKDQLKDRFKPGDKKYVGFDAYKQLLASDLDLVILATPPAFRPEHLKHAIEAGKHIFMEKPVAVDAPGIRSVIASAELAKQKKLAIVAGTQRRHDLAYVEAMKRIHDGHLGDITACYAYWNQGGLWMHPRQAAWSDMEWQLRNWLYFTWLSGDHIVEQHIHNIDVCNWAMNAHPVKAVSLGGRQVRTDPAYGHIFDHFATEYEYANGVKMISMCRQIDGTASRVAEQIVGTKGVSDANNRIKGDKEWRWDGDRPNPYMLEHKDLIASIRAGSPLNEGRQVAESTMTAILGRMAAYSGQEISWDAAMKSEVSLAPEKLAMGSLSVPPVAVPGKTTAL